METKLHNQLCTFWWKNAWQNDELYMWWGFLFVVVIFFEVFFVFIYVLFHFYVYVFVEYMKYDNQ